MKSKLLIITLLFLTTMFCTVPFASAQTQPTVTSASPGSRGQGDGVLSQNITISGNNFVNGPSLAVNFGDANITVNTVTFVSSSQLTVNITIAGAAVVGLRNVTVTNGDDPGGTVPGTGVGIFVVNAAPTVTSTNPSNLQQGKTNQDVVITGTNFKNNIVGDPNAPLLASNFGAGITVNSTTFVSNTQLLANITVAPTAVPGTRNVTVTNGDAGVGVGANIFTVISAPTVTAVNPTSHGQGATGQVIDITGTGFQGVAGPFGGTVTFSGTGITVTVITLNSATSLTATINVASNAATTARSITVVNPDGGGGTGANLFTVNPAPVVNSVNPNTLGQLATRDVIINGSNFENPITLASLNFGTGITVNNATRDSATQITANISVGLDAAPGPRNVTVTNGDAGVGTGTGIFTVNVAPTVTSVNPTNRGQGATNQNITVTGANFVSGAEVSFSGTGITVNSTTFVSATQLTANINVSGTAPVDGRSVVVTNPDGGTGTGVNIFTVNARPTVTSTNPNNLPQGASNQDVDITGTNFVNGAQASFGAGVTVNSTTFVNATTLTANITIPVTTTPGTCDVTVTNPDAGVGTGTAVFRIVSRPQITGISPNNRGQGALNQNIIITGQYFMSPPAPAVAFSGAGITVNNVTFNSATQLTVNIDIAQGAATTARDVTVTNADGGTVTGTGLFTVNIGPTITSITPTNRGRGATNQTIDIVGTNFKSPVVIDFGADITINSTTYISITRLQANITILGTATLGAHVAAVINSIDAGRASIPFTVNSEPTGIAAAPANMAQGASNQNVVITTTSSFDPIGNQVAGNPFGGSVAFSGTGITVNSATFTNATTLTVNISISSGAATGLRNITVTNPDAGVGVGTEVFTVISTPTITSVSPDSRGQNSTNQNITITGTNFQGTAGTPFTGVVAFSGAGITINSVTYNSSTRLTANIAIAAGAATGYRDVTVTNPDGGTVTAINIFRVAAAPVVLNVNPNTRPQGSTSNVTITGHSFIAGASLASNFGAGITVNSTTFVNVTTLTANITIATNAALGARNVTVTNGDAGVGVGAGLFNVISGPTVTNLNPSSRGQGATAQNITVTGTNFQAGATAVFSGTGITVNSVTFTSATSLTVNITIAGNAATGERSITVTNSPPGDGGSSGAVSGLFTVNSAPTVTSTNPNKVIQGTLAQTVDIIGTNFVSGAPLGVAFSGIGITIISFNYISSTLLRVNIDIATDATEGSRNVTVTNGDAGVGTGTNVFTVVNYVPAAPSIAGINPTSRGQGATNQVIAINGDNFQAGASVTFSGSGITVNTVTFVNVNQLNVNISIGADATTVARDVTVTNVQPAQSATLSGAFTVNAKPVITGTNPNISPVPPPWTGNVNISGGGFTNLVSVSFIDPGTSEVDTNIPVNITTLINSTLITVNITMTAGAASGPRHVRVVNGDGGVGTGNNLFTVLGGYTPIVNSATPNSRGQGAVNQDVTIGGGTFQGTAGQPFGGTVSFGNGITVNSVTFVSANALRANISIGSDATVGARDVTVTNPDQTTGIGVGIFTVNPKPTIVSILPAVLAQGVINQNIVITGSNFMPSDPILVVSFSGTGIPVNSTTYNSPTQITANVDVDDDATVGSRDMTVTNGDGGITTIEDILTIQSTPTIAAVSPNNRGQGAENQDIVITGTNFMAGATVSFSNAGITVNSVDDSAVPTQLTANISIDSSAALGVCNITVTNPDEGKTQDTPADDFTVNVSPTVTSATPVVPQDAVGFDVTITGDDFVAGASLDAEIIDPATGLPDPNITVNSVTLVSATELTINVDMAVPIAEIGARDVKIINGDAGVGVGEGILTVQSAPTIVSVTPNSGVQGAQNQNIVIAGTNFVAGVAVEFSGTDITVNSATVDSDTKITANISIALNATVGLRDVTVTNPDDGTDTLVGGFTVNVAPPVITGITPNHAVLDATLDVVITGSNFVGGVGQAVQFSGTGITVNSVVVNTATKITANITIASDAPIGLRDLTVTNPNGGQDTLEDAFRVDSPLSPPTDVAVTGNLINLANVKNVEVTGKATANIKVKVTLGTVTKEGTADATGSFAISVDASGLADGNIVVTAIVIDEYDNESASSSPITVLKDTIAPAAPTNVAVTTGKINKANVTAVEVTGKAEANVKVKVTLGTATKEGTADATGSFKISVDASVLADKLDIPVTATAIDEQGNESASSSPITVTKDTVAPASITLTAEPGADYGQISLSWTAPGDDGNVGTATNYIVKSSTKAIASQVDFDAASTLSGAPTPKVAGSSENMVVPNLTIETTYYFAIEAVDDVGNQGSLSTLPPGVKPQSGDTTAPVITHTPVTTANAGEPLKISAVLTDNVGVVSAKVIVKVGGKVAPGEEPMVQIEGTSNWTATISGSIKGVAYAIKAADAKENTKTTSLYPVAVTGSMANPDEYQLIQKWYQISFPLAGDGAFPSDWETDSIVWTYDSSKQDWVKITALPDPKVGAFVMLYTTSKTLTIEGQSADITKDAEIKLKWGWNLIGLPFPFSRFLDDNTVKVKADGYSPVPITEASNWVYNKVYQIDPDSGKYKELIPGSQTTPDDEKEILKPFASYWVLALQPDTSLIISPMAKGPDDIPPTPAAPSIRVSQLPVIAGIQPPSLPVVPKTIPGVALGENGVGQNYPNPFNPDTWVPYQLKEASDVTVDIYNMTGQLVRTLKLGHKPVGLYVTKEQAAHWDGRNNAGDKVASGIYFYQLKTGTFTSPVYKMVILK